MAEAKKSMAGRAPEAPRGMLGKVVDKVLGALKDWWADLRIGDGHATGMFRKGAVEAGQYLPAFNNAGMATVEDQGVWPNATQMQINHDKGVTGIDAEQQRPTVHGKPGLVAEARALGGAKDQGTVHGRDGQSSGLVAQARALGAQRQEAGRQLQMDLSQGR